MPKQINTFTFGQRLVEKFGLKGRFQPVLDEVIVPVTVVESNIQTRLAVGGALGTASGPGIKTALFSLTRQIPGWWLPLSSSGPLPGRR